MSKPFNEPVISPWASAIRDAPEFYYPKSTIWDDGEYFISKLHDDCYLYFIKKEDKYYAFNQLAGFNTTHIDKVKRVLDNQYVTMMDNGDCLAFDAAIRIRNIKE